MFAVQADGAEISTVESLAPRAIVSRPLQQEFKNNHALQCGYCTPGMLISATALLEQTPDPTEQQIREYLAGNLCRCTGYTPIVQRGQSRSRGPGHGEAARRLMLCVGFDATLGRGKALERYLIAGRKPSWRNCSKA